MVFRLTGDDTQIYLTKDINAMKRPDKDSGLLELVREAFENSKRGYGYKRVHLELKGMGVRVSAKRVMRLTARHGLAPLFKSAKRYSSYKGEPAKAPKNLVNRDFHAERPNMLWVTDLTEFSIPAGKAYLSPVIDCYDGLPVAWTIGCFASIFLKQFLHYFSTA